VRKLDIMISFIMNVNYHSTAKVLTLIPTYTWDASNVILLSLCCCSHKCRQLWLLHSNRI